MQGWHNPHVHNAFNTTHNPQLRIPLISTPDGTAARQDFVVAEAGAPKKPLGHGDFFFSGL
jgi:hypothetical protein